MSTREKVLFVDLHAQHAEIQQEIKSAISTILDTSSFIGGDIVSQFETDFANFLGVKEVVGVSNGTDALWLALLSAGIGPGDAVITVPNTFIATVEGITRAGAHPLFVDIDLATANMSPQALEDFLKDQCSFSSQGDLIHITTGYRVAAVLPVHLYGLPVDMIPILDLCQHYHLFLIEDACQAHGAAYLLNGQWKKAGSIGVAAAFSFYPGKNLGALGDAGAVATNDSRMADQIKTLRNHGSREKYIHVSSYGWNARLDTLQAAVLSIKLRRLDFWNECRRQAAGHYYDMLHDLPLELPVEPEGRRHVYHIYAVRTAERDRLKKGLFNLGIETGVHYPIPLHLQPAYAWLGYAEGSFPNAELSAASVLSLPMHPYLTVEKIEQIAEACAQLLSGKFP